MQESSQEPTPEPAAESTPRTPGELWRELGPAGLLGLAWTVLPGVFGITLLVKLGAVSEWLTARPGESLLLYTLGFAAAAGAGLLPTYTMAILGGWVFGFAAGFPAALAGFTLAAAIGFCIARLVARNSMERMIAGNERARVVHRALLGRGATRSLGLVTLLRVPPSSPFSLTNLVMAGTGVKFAPFVVGTALGMAPRTVVYVATGAGGAASGARDIGEFVKDGPGWIVAVVGVVLMLGVLSLLSNVANRALERVASGESTEDGGLAEDAKP